MLKKEVMAKKVSKFMVSSINTESKESIEKAIEESYVAGYDLAVSELKIDNSKMGYTMAEHLEYLEDNCE